MAAVQLAALLAARYRDRLNVIRSTTAARAAAVWDAMPAVTGDGVDDVFVEALAPVIQGGIDATTALTDAYIAAAINLGTQDGVEVLGVTANTIGGLRGVDDRTVLRRPMVQMWKALSDGTPFNEARNAARARVEEMASTTVQLSMKDTAEAYAGDKRVKGWKRTLTGNSCGLCAIASTQRYRRPNLMPIHGHCDCGIAPIVGKDDPGQIINKPLYEELSKRGEIDKVTAARVLPNARESLANAEKRVSELHKELADGIADPARERRVRDRLDSWQSTAAKRADKVARLEELNRKPLAAQVTVHQHGELGPVLYSAHHSFDTAA